MEPLTAEFTIHRIGGPDLHEGMYYWARDYAGTGHVGPNAYNHITGVHRSVDMLTVQFHEVEQVEQHWLGGRLVLATVNGQPIGRAPSPFMLYGLPWDVPTWTHFHDTWLGHYSLGIRLTGTPADISRALAEEAEQRAHAELPAEAYAAGERAPAEQGEQ